MKQINLRLSQPVDTSINEYGETAIINRDTILRQLNNRMQNSGVSVSMKNYPGIIEYIFQIKLNKKDDLGLQTHANITIQVDNTETDALIALNKIAVAFQTKQKAQINNYIKQREEMKRRRFRLKAVAVATIATIAVGGFVLVKNNKKINQYVTSKIITQLEKDRLANDNDALEEQLYYQNSMDQEADKSR